MDRLVPLFRRLVLDRARDRLPEDPEVKAAPSPPLLEDIQLWPVLGADHRVRLEPTGKRVRAFLGATAVADSTRVMMMFEAGRLPVYYFPVDDVRT